MFELGLTLSAGRKRPQVRLRQDACRQRPEVCVGWFCSALLLCRFEKRLASLDGTESGTGTRRAQATTSDAFAAARRSRVGRLPGRENLCGLLADVPTHSCAPLLTSVGCEVIRWRLSGRSHSWSLRPRSSCGDNGWELSPCRERRNGGDLVRRAKPDVVVGSSRGGVVAMNIDPGSTPVVLLCPAWKFWGTARTMKLGTVILHSRADETVPCADSEELVRNSGLPLEPMIEVGTETPAGR